MREIDVVGHARQPVPRDFPLLSAVFPDLGLLGIFRNGGGVASEANLRLRERREHPRLNPLMAMAALKAQLRHVEIVIKGDRLGRCRSPAGQDHPGRDNRTEEKDSTCHG